MAKKLTPRFATQARVILPGSERAPLIAEAGVAPVQEKAAAAPALRLVTCTLSATMKAE